MLKNATAITFYFISMICFAAGYLVKNAAPVLYVITMVCGVVFLVIGFLRRTNK